MASCRLRASNKSLKPTPPAFGLRGGLARPLPTSACKVTDGNQLRVKRLRYERHDEWRYGFDVRFKVPPVAPIFHPQGRKIGEQERGERRESRRQDELAGHENVRLAGRPLLRSPFYFLLSSATIQPMSFTFEKLVVYQKAVEFADASCSQTKDFPRGYFFLADQLNRAALSIAVNIAEGNGRFTKPDRKNFFGIARGSVQECVPLLDVARRKA